MFNSLSLKYKLLLPNLFFVVLLLVVGGLYLQSKAKIRDLGAEQRELAALTSSVRDLSLQTQEYLEDRRSFEDVSEMHDNLVEQAKGSPLAEELDALWTHVEDVEAKRVQNTAISEQIRSLAAGSIEKSNGYIRQVSEKLADEEGRANVSTLERLVIIGANVNTTSNYEVLVRFGQLEKNLAVKDSLLQFLDLHEKNTKKDVERLAGTPYQPMAIAARDLNTQIKRLAMEFIANTEQQYESREAISVAVAGCVAHIDAMGEKASREFTSGIATSFFLIMMTLVVGTAVLAVVVAVIVSYTISRPVGKTVALLKDIAEGEGDLTRRLDDSRGDELGEMARWFNTFVEKLQQIIIKVSQNAAVVAESSRALTETATEMASGAETTSRQSANVTSAAEETSTNMSGMANSTERMAANVRTVAAAVEELTASIAEIAKNASEAASVADQANRITLESNKEIGQLGDAADEIGKVIQTIQDIAEQTNLLALNATIEAARAGEAGKGFAVVATEVKELAKQTATATEDIRSRIERIQVSTGEAVTSIGTIGEVIQKVNDVSQTIASAVEEQSATTKEIAHNVAETSTAAEAVRESATQSAMAGSEITKSIVEVDNAAKRSAAGATETQAAAADLTRLGSELTELVSSFRT